MTPDPDLTADVDRWLTDQIRTNWPNITADVLDDDERPAVAAWFATEITRFEAWRREQGSGGTGMPRKPSAGTQDVITDLLMLVGEPDKSPIDSTPVTVWDGWRYRPARPMPPPRAREMPYTTYAGIPLEDPTERTA